MMEVQEKIIHLFTITLFWSIVFVNGMLHHPPRFQPQLDQLNLEKYVNDDYLFKMHINCLFYDGPCDPVGSWMKPRMASFFLNSCILCTNMQEKDTDKFMTYLYENHPQLFRIGIAKYLDANGIKLPAKSKFREQVNKMNVPKVEISTSKEKSELDSSVEEKDDNVSVGTAQDDNRTENQRKEEGEGNNKSDTSDNKDTSLQKTQSTDEENGPSERVLNTNNARKNKFSSAIAFSSLGSAGGGSDRRHVGYISGNKQLTRINTPTSTMEEDDEAEADFKFYH